MNFNKFFLFFFSLYTSSIIAPLYAMATTSQPRVIAIDQDHCFTNNGKCFSLFRKNAEIGRLYYGIKKLNPLVRMIDTSNLTPIFDQFVVRALQELQRNGTAAIRWNFDADNAKHFINKFGFKKHSILPDGAIAIEFDFSEDGDPEKHLIRYQNELTQRQTIVLKLRSNRVSLFRQNKKRFNVTISHNAITIHDKKSEIAGIFFEGNIIRKFFNNGSTSWDEYLMIKAINSIKENGRYKKALFDTNIQKHTPINIEKFGFKKKRPTAVFAYLTLEADENQIESLFSHYQSQKEPLASSSCDTTRDSNTGE